MASPFTIFRRHQKVMIAALTLLAMFAFVFLDPLLEHLGGGGGVNPTVVATRAYGDLRESDVSNLVRQRQLVLSVLRQVLSSGGMHPAIIDYWVQQRFGEPTEESVVQTWLHAQRAESLGMVVDDRAVNDFLNLLLQELTENQVGIGEIARVLERDKVPQRIFFAALRKELLARQFQRSFQLSLMGIPPMQRWDYYQRLNRRADIELVPVSVVDFMDQIKDPGEDVLRAFFEVHKSTEWRPDIPEPAFRQPKRIALQYFKAELDDLVKLDSVTDEEVAQYYEENKEARYLRPQASAPAESEKSPTSSDPAPRESGEEPAGEKPAPPVGDQPAGEQPGEAKPSTETPMGGDEPAPETVKPTDAAGEPEEKQPSEPMAEPMDAPADADSPAPTPEPATDGAAMHSSGAGARFMFTAYQKEDEASVPKSDEPAKEAAEPADAESPEPPMSEPANAAEPKPESTEPKPEPMAPESTPESTKPEGSADEPKVESPEAPPTVAAPEPAAPERSTIDGRPAGTQLYLPLDEVRDEIRHTLARRKAQANIEEVLGLLSSQMQKYYDDLTRYEVRVEDDPKAVKPADLDMGKLAAEHGLRSFATALISAWEAQSLDIGESLVDGASPFVRTVFENLPLFHTAVSQSAGSYFLFWKTEQEESRVPDWKDENVQAQVLQAWKLVEARTLARAEAETLAKKVRESGNTLEQFFAKESKYEVVHAGPFSWMTSGDVPAMLAREPPRISEVEGVSFAGQQFMRDVFALGEGEVGVTMNQPETFAYVVRMASLVPPQAILWEGFLVDDFGKYVAAGAPDFGYMQSAWQKEVEEAAGLEWKRVPWRGRDGD